MASRRIAVLLAIVLAAGSLPAQAQQRSGASLSITGSNATLPAARNNLGIDRRLTDDFGAVCDGATDDAAAFAAAVTWVKAAVNRVVQLPAAVCATSQTVVYGDGRQRSTTLSSGLSGGETSLPVASITGILNGDYVYVRLDSGFYKGTVNGTPAAGNVPITPALTGAAASGNAVFSADVSTYNGGGFIGYGSGADVGEFPGGAPISGIKYIGSAAPATTLGGAASLGDRQITVASIANFELGGAIKIALDNGRVWWTTVRETPTGTTVKITNEIPSTATSGNAVTIANNPVFRVAGPIYSVALRGVQLDANSLASIGLESISAFKPRFEDVVSINYTGVGHFHHTQSAPLGVTGAVSDGDYRLYSRLPENTKTLGLWIAGNAEQNVGFSRNRFHGGTFTMGGNDITAAAIRNEFADNNTLFKTFTYYNGAAVSGAGIYRQMPYNADGLGENAFYNSTIIGGVTDGAATGGSLQYDHFWPYTVADGAPAPTGKELGVTTTGVFFGNFGALNVGALLAGLGSSTWLSVPTSANPVRVMAGGNAADVDLVLQPKGAGQFSTKLPGYGSGCTLSNNSGTPNTIVDISACSTADDVNGWIMHQRTAYTKTTGAWSLGTGGGGLDTGAVANSTWYYLYQIQRSDTLVVDYVMTATYGSPTMPANYDRKRYIGPIKTNGSAAISPFTQSGNAFTWTAPVLDINGASIGTSAALQTLASVPNGYKVLAYFRAETFKAAAAPQMLLSDPAETDVAPNAQEGNSTIVGQVVGSGTFATLRLRTNTAQQVRARSSADATSLWINIVGWDDPQIAWAH